MRSADVIVLGAGMGGLFAAQALARAGARVLVLEARQRIGGRVNTLNVAGWPQPVELGAEFVHGAPEALLALAREAGAELTPDEAPHFVKTERGYSPNDAVWAAMAELFASERTRATDRSAQELLASARLDADTARMIALFVEGFHAAELSRVSARSVAVQMSSADERQQRLTRGYAELARSVEARALANGARVLLGTAAERVEWKPGAVTVHAGGDTYDANSLVVALPLSLLKEGAVRFDPDITRARRAMERLEMGHAYRAVVRLEEPIWRSRGLGESVFVHDPALELPTFWTSTAGGAAQITAWCGGTRALRLVARCASEPALRNAVLEALSSVLEVPIDRLRRAVLGVHSHVFSTDPLSRGGYPYVLTGGDPSGAFEPEGETLFFVGDYTDASELGTVGSTVARALRVAEALLARSGRLA